MLWTQRELTGEERSPEQAKVSINNLTVEFKLAPTGHEELYLHLKKLQISPAIARTGSAHPSAQM